MGIHVIALEGFHERLRHTVRLWAADRRKARNQAQANSKLDRLKGSVAAPIVREPLDRVRRFGSSKAPLYTPEHKIADHLATVAAGARTPGHDLPITGVERKGNTHDLTVPAGDFEAIRSPSQVRSDRDDLAVVSSSWWLSGVSLQQ